MLGSIDQLPLAIPPGTRRVLLVADAAACRAAGIEARLAGLLTGVEVARFDDFGANPRLEDLERLLGSVTGNRDPFDAFPFGAIIAIGGGTAIDLAKLAALGLTNAGVPARTLLGEGFAPRDALPIVAVPTTAGTGSEATRFAVVYVDGVKRSIDHPSLLPTRAIVDPTLTHSLPPRQTAATGLDAFCQSIEALWAVAATDESDPVAEEAAALAWEWLPIAVHAPTPEARAAMCRAAHLAGRAINVTRTTAPHALSYHLTSAHGVPHGFAVAFSLPVIVLFNDGVTEGDCNDPRGVAHVRAKIGRVARLVGVTSVADAASAIRDWIAEVGSPTLPEEVGLVDAEAIDAWVASANPQRAGNNPRRLGAAALKRLFSPGARA
ncbi:MAG: phosphonoacetaldehyde reductase [Lacipirellulaceae bacterium]